jgi:ABC-type uncharacterized transport system substrate-binding protein
MIQKRLIPFVFALFATTVAASAHPHLYANMQTAVMTTAEGKISGLKVTWEFDEMYTQFSLEGLDLNNNGTYEPEEIQPLTDENIKNLLDSKYFTIGKQNGSELAQSPVKVYGQGLKDNKLTLWFELPFATPVDLKAGFFEALIYDPDFFIAFDYLQTDPVKVEGALPTGCAFSLKPLPSNEELDQTRTMLSEKGQDWKPEQPTDFGAMFAQPLVVSCS